MERAGKIDRLEFHTSVLGQKASERLRNGQVSITFRSKPPTTRCVEVYLDDELLGNTDIKVSQHRVCLGIALDPDNALLCGFDTVVEQEEALKRAGFRFRPIGSYYVYQVTLLNYEEREPLPMEETLVKPEIQIVERVVEVPIVKEVMKEVPLVQKIRVEPLLTEEQLKPLTRSIANKIILPGRPVETRIWQLRIANNVINLIKPYLRIKSLKEVRNKGE